MLRQLLGVGLVERTGALVPVSVGPGPRAGAVLLVVAYAACVGRRAGTRAAQAVAGGRGPQRTPRPWLAVGLFALAVLIGGGYAGELVGLRHLGGLRALVGPVTFLLLRPWLLDAVDGASLRTE